MYRIVIKSKNGLKKVVNAQSVFGKDEAGKNLPSQIIDNKVRSMAWDTFGSNTESVEWERI